MEAKDSKPQLSDIDIDSRAEEAPRRKDGFPRFYHEYYNAEGNRKQECDRTATSWKEAIQSLYKYVTDVILGIGLLVLIAVPPHPTPKQKHVN